jgi:small subunit ribosomal protein S17
MAKILEGTVISTKMQNTIVVEVTRKKPHPLYKKLLKRSKKYKVVTNGETVVVGSTVRIVETKPMSKDKHFVLLKSADATSVAEAMDGKKAMEDKRGRK